MRSFLESSIASTLVRFATTSGLRVVSLVGRSVLLVYMARYLGPASLGRYGLVSAAAAYAVLALGLEFHFFNTRKILEQADPFWRARCMANQFVMHAMFAPVGFMLLLGLFVFGMLPWSAAGWVYAIILFDHIAQECTRFMMTLQRPMIANSMYALRSGWMYVIAAIGIINPAYRTLQIIWTGWVVGSASCIVLAAWTLRKFPWSRVPLRPDWNWIRRGLRTSSPFFVATLSLTALTIFDRYTVEAYRGIADVGIYTLYAAIGAAIQALVHANVGMLLYPRVISAYQTGNMQAYRIHIRKMAWQAPALALLFAAMAGIGITPLLSIIGKPIYADYLPLLWIVLAGTVMAAAAEAPHAALYVRGRDKSLVAVDIVTGFCGIALLFILVPRWGVYGAAAVVALSYLQQYLFRGILFIYARR